MSEQKNMIIAAALSFLVIVVWQFFLAPPPPAPPVEQTAAIEGQPAEGAPPTAAPAPQVEAPAALPREQALANAPRVPIATPKLSGSISLRGGRLDDLSLTEHRETIDPSSPPVTLLSPFGSEHPYYAIWGWTPSRDQAAVALPGPDAEWRVESGDRLTPEQPVTLAWDNGAGLTFRRTFSVDRDYMFAVTQSVQNGTDQPVSLAPYGIVARHGVPKTQGTYILHEGGVGEFDGTLKEFKYSKMEDLTPDPAEGGPAERIGVTNNGWLGFTDKYWMAAQAGGPNEPFTGVFKVVQAAGGPVFQSDMRQPAITVAPGETAQASAMLFAGAKDTRLLQRYERDLDIAGFEDAVDWGWFFFLTKPMFWLLMFIHDIVGNMGWAIILLTVVVKTILFPLAYKSFVSMSRMKKLQPEMEKIKERVGDDKMKMQQEMIALYKREKVNPASGCLPILLQIPIFFSLYKVIFVTLELRHAPFIGWIKDLSAPDPSSWVNLFGLLPYDASVLPGFLALFSIGLFPLVMGVTMWLQQKLNPAPTDPVQAQIFGLMPIMFTFMLGHFASGLVIYWTANNILTFIQQYTIMRSQGVDVDVLGNVKRSFKRKRAAE
jgi:YidC/Oxa1 family membrane protein insertase